MAQSISRASALPIPSITEPPKPHTLRKIANLALATIAAAGLFFVAGVEWLLAGAVVYVIMSGISNFFNIEREDNRTLVDYQARHEARTTIQHLSEYTYQAQRYLSEANIIQSSCSTFVHNIVFQGLLSFMLVNQKHKDSEVQTLFVKQHQLDGYVDEISTCIKEMDDLKQQINTEIKEKTLKNEGQRQSYFDKALALNLKALAASTNAKKIHHEIKQLHNDLRQAKKESEMPGRIARVLNWAHLRKLPE